MRSPTQRSLSPEEVADLIRHSLGAQVVNTAEMPGGSFATVWEARLDDGRAVVLKMAPPPHARLLSYELGLVEAEAAYFARVRREVPGVPVPEILHLDTDFLIMELLPGTPLNALGPLGQSTAREAPVRRQLGAAVARLHALDGPEFGYIGAARRRGPTWRTIFLDIVDDLLADAVRLGSDLPVPAAEIAGTVARIADCLDEVSQPVAVHFDLWDGNVLAQPDPDGTLRLSGLVDGERYLYADPLVDFVSPHLFGALEHEPSHPFVLGYTETMGTSLTWDEAARTRIRLYRLWLYLVMYVEIPARALSAQRPMRTRLLKDALTALR